MKRLIFLCIALGLLLLACTPKGKEAKPDQFSKAATQPAPSVALELKDANQLLGQRRCTDAANLYLKFLQKYPKDPQAWNFLGLAYLCDAKYDLAQNAFRQSLTFAPTYSDVHNNLGVLYMEMKNYPEAKKEYMKALEDVN